MNACVSVCVYGLRSVAMCSCMSRCVRVFYWQLYVQENHLLCVTHRKFPRHTFHSLTLEFSQKRFFPGRETTEIFLEASYSAASDICQDQDQTQNQIDSGGLRMILIPQVESLIFCLCFCWNQLKTQLCTCLLLVLLDHDLLFWRKIQNCYRHQLET